MTAVDQKPVGAIFIILLNDQAVAVEQQPVEVFRLLPQTARSGQLRMIPNMPAIGVTGSSLEMGTVSDVYKADINELLILAKDRW